MGELPATLQRALGQLKDRIDYSKANVEKAKAIILAAGLDAVTSYGSRAIDIAIRMGSTPLVRWLIEQRVDVSIPDHRGETPLHNALYWHHLEMAEVLLDAGAPIEAATKFGYTPITRIFANCFSDPAPLVRLMIEHGAKMTPEARKLGFEWNAAAFEALLVELGLDAKPPADFTPRTAPDPGHPPPIARITVPVGDWKQQHAALWDLLVPKSGASATLQGEVVRLSGKLTREAYTNGNINWSASTTKDWRFIGKTLLTHNALSPADAARVATAIDTIIRNRNAPDVSGDGSPYYLVEELVVRWVLANPVPVAV